MNSKEKKILFLVPDGVGVRNYLYSDIIKNIKKTSEIIIWSGLPKVAFDSVEALHEIEVGYQFLELKKQSIVTKILTESATYARLIHNSKLVKNKTILANWNKSRNDYKQTVQKAISETIGFWASKKYKRILWLEKTSTLFWSRRVINHYKRELETIQPDVVFITHQRVAALMPVCIAANELNTKVITAIYSWDNLPKARLAVHADIYLVWSDYMKSEMNLYYPEISSIKSIVTGTPQFEFYTQKDIICSREQFATKYNLDIAKKWICFSGDDTITSPYDDLYLDDLAERIASIDDHLRPLIIFRRSPADESNRYDNVLKKYKRFIRPINPIWKNYGLGWGTNFPEIDDVNLLVNLAFHCDLVINIGSTMAHDFAVFDKPCLYLNYNQFKSTDWNVETIYNFQHFRSMENFDAVGWVNCKDEFLDKINQALYDPSKIGSERKKWLDTILLHPLDKSSFAISKELLMNKVVI